jgi:exodeoxyribonuclease-1
MSFVFYDTETTGISTSFDQILQFAAIKTDSDLNELDRIEIRCRLLPHVIPHPGALKVTGMSIERVTDAALPCHYEMIRAVRTKLAEWSPAIFVGYNSMNFDEHLLRQALFRTLHAPYLTNSDGNNRADALTLVQAASQFAPDCLTIPVNHKGNAIFKLDHVAPANGFAHDNAHDALADVEATIYLARCVRDEAPECWSRFLRFSSKAGVSAFLEDEEALLLTEFYYNRPYHFVVSAIGADPDNPSARFCLDLRHDLDWIASLPDAALAAWVAASPKPVRKLRMNASPSIAPLDEVDPGFLGDLDEALIADRVARLREDEELRERLIAAVMAGREGYEESPHVEEQIYSGFIPDADKGRMDLFHLVPWPNRVAIVDSFEDQRLRYHGYRLIYERHPEVLNEETRAFYYNHDRARLMDVSGAAKWNTLPLALAAIAEAEVGSTEEQAGILAAYRLYLETRIAAGG